MFKLKTNNPKNKNHPTEKRKLPIQTFSYCMAGFLSAFTNPNHHSMGGAASTGKQMSAEDYESLAMTLSPTTRNRLPDTSTALSLMEDFQALSLSGGSNGDRNGDNQCCHQCSQSVREQVAQEVIARSDTIEKEMNSQPFIYRGCMYCSLDCFFDAYVKQPGLCMWIDSLFSAAVKLKTAQIHSSHGGSKMSHK